MKLSTNRNGIKSTQLEYFEPLIHFDNCKFGGKRCLIFVDALYKFILFIKNNYGNKVDSYAGGGGGSRKDCIVAPAIGGGGGVGGLGGDHDDSVVDSVGNVDEVDDGRGQSSKQNIFLLKIFIR